MQRHEYLYTPQKRKKNSHDKTNEIVPKSLEKRKKKREKKYWKTGSRTDQVP